MAALVDVLVLVVNSLLTVLVGVGTWVGRKYARQIERNSSLRVMLVGDADLDQDDGTLDRWAELHSRLEADHEEVREMLREVRREVHQIRTVIDEADAVDADLEDSDYPITDD